MPHLVLEHSVVIPFKWTYSFLFRERSNGPRGSQRQNHTVGVGTQSFGPGLFYHHPKVIHYLLIGKIATPVYFARLLTSLTQLQLSCLLLYVRPGQRLGTFFIHSKAYT